MSSTISNEKSVSASAQVVSGDIFERDESSMSTLSTFNELAASTSLVSTENSQWNDQVSTDNSYATPSDESYLSSTLDRVSFSATENFSSSATFENDLTTSSIDVSHLSNTNSLTTPHPKPCISWSWDGLESLESSNSMLSNSSSRVLQIQSDINMKNRSNNHPPFHDIALMFQCILNSTSSNSSDAVVIRTLAELAESFWRCRKYSKAIEAYQELLLIIGVHNMKVTPNNDKCKQQNKQIEDTTRFQTRKNILEQILTAIRILENHLQYGLYMEQTHGEYYEAIQSYKRALQYGIKYLPIEDYLHIGIIWRCIGTCLYHAGLYTKGIEALHKSREVLHRTLQKDAVSYDSNDTTNQVQAEDIEVLHTLGLCCMNIKSYTEAMRVFHSALQLLSHNTSTSITSDRNSCNNNRREICRFQYGIARTLMYLGEVYVHTQQYHKAHEMFDDARILLSRTVTTNSIATTKVMHNRSTEDYSIRATNRISDGILLAEVEHQQGIAYAAQGRYSHAMQCYQASLGYHRTTLIRAPIPSKANIFDTTTTATINPNGDAAENIHNIDCITRNKPTTTMMGSEDVFVRMSIARLYTKTTSIPTAPTANTRKNSHARAMEMYSAILHEYGYDDYTSKSTNSGSSKTKKRMSIRGMGVIGRVLYYMGLLQHQHHHQQLRYLNQALEVQWSMIRGMRALHKYYTTEVHAYLNHNQKQHQQVEDMILHPHIIDTSLALARYHSHQRNNSKKNYYEIALQYYNDTLRFYDTLYHGSRTSSDNRVEYTSIVQERNALRRTVYVNRLLQYLRCCSNPHPST